ncbi:GGDEF domain-containing protein [Lederbergia citri]|uniref:GGDEF domain-containing protein n=1 Tax=Lederbergia citri TaxID=2833580 RepID=A0A942YG51_9BACI|nr:GGDEF domain-containing protein [Lederbergia citri]MBS4195753.1 GGDEF domain-containing protein [Lederbergia citri]
MEFKGRIIAVLTVVFIQTAWIIYNIAFMNIIFHRFLFLAELIVIYWLGKKVDDYKFLSERDFLTKLYNRRYVFNVFPKLANHLRSDEKINVFVLDINDFKGINDTYGHKMGDYVLKGISKSLLMSMGEKDIVARLGGDEFLIIAPSKKIIPTEVIFRRIEKTLNDLSKKMEVSVSISIGKSVYPDRAETLDDLIRLADIKMYKNKVLHKDELLYRNTN